MKTHIDDLPEFDPAAYLNDEAAIEAYLSDILRAENPELLVSALNDIARARGQGNIESVAGIDLETLRTALQLNPASRSDILNRLCVALKVPLSA